MNYSIYQLALFGAVETGTNSIIVSAVAGSGKTTSIVEACNRLPPTKSVLFLAFNKAIVEELKERLPAGVDCRTFNSAGWGAWRKFTGKKMIKIESNKTRNIIRDYFRDDERAIYGAFVNRMVGLAKSSGLLIDSSDEDWMDLAEHHGLYLDSEGADIFRAIMLSKKTLEKSIEISHSICDFDDQIYMPWLEMASFDRYDVVFIDEAQDTNGVQKELLKRMLKPDGRLIAVGDPAQAIYGFRGADSDSMDSLRSSFQAVELPLSISYRCCKAVVVEAQKYVSHIEAFSNAPDGKVENVDNYNADTFGANDAILCRKNAPLIEFAYQLIARGRGVNFLGRDIGGGLKTLVKQMNADDVDDLSVRMERWLTRETEKLVEKGQEEKADVLGDRVNCIEIFISHLPETHRSIKHLIAAIDSLFVAMDRGVVLASVHKSKGREWNKVFILDFHLMPSPMAKKPWQQVQENNLIYVAITRAKEHLCYINSKCWTDEAGFFVPDVDETAGSDTKRTSKRGSILTGFNPLKK